MKNVFRGAAPRSEDYIIKYDFPQQQLMSGGHQPQSQLHSGSGFESAAILSPQVKFK